MHRSLVATGVVKFFKDNGCGAISSDELPPDRDAWVHVSDIESDGYKFLVQGDLVEFDYVEHRYNSFDYVVTRVRKV